MSPMGQAALQYARHGWPVFPCRERDESVTRANGKVVHYKAKAPYSGQGFKDATTDERRIEAWWRQHPQALIGLPMGVNGLFALDFDPRIDAESGEVFTLETLKADLEAQIGVALPPSLTAITQSDGVHVYFRQPDDGGDPIRNRGNLPDHVDVRGLGGYVIAPPSIMVDTDARYRWHRGDWRDAGACVPAPAELIAVLRAPKARPAEAGPPAGAAPRLAPAPQDVAGEALQKYAMRALEGEVRAIRTAGTGNRNGQLNESALKIASLVAATVDGRPAGALDERFARSTIEAAARDNPGRDDDKQLSATIDSGWTAGLASPRDLGEIAAAARERGSRRQSAGPPSRGAPAPPPAPPAPDPDDDGQPSSHAGGGRLDIGSTGGGDDRLTRACAFMPQTDLGNLERFLKRHGDDFLFVEAWGWLAWDTRRWNRDMALALIGRAVQDTMRAIQEEADLIAESGIPDEPMALFDAEQLRAHEAQQRGKLDRIVKRNRDGSVVLFSEMIAKWGRTSESAGHISCIAKMAEARLSARPEDFDADPLLLNVANGTLVFRRPAKGKPARVKLRPADRRDRNTKVATAAYDPDARSPLFDAFLEEVQPDADMRAFLDVWGGYGALGLAEAQKMAVFYGQGSNGKGVWINTVARLLGDYAWAAAIETFIDQGKYRKGSDASPDLAALAGRRMVYANEPEEGSKFSDGLIKAMTSDEPLGGVRELLKAPFELQVTFTNTVSANHRPKIGTDHGIQRRVQIVPWDVIIPDERADLMLKAKLKAEFPGILNRVVAGALQYLDTGLPVPEAVRTATREYQEENDILGQFLALCIETSKGETIGASALHELFKAWQTWANLLPSTGKPWSPKYLNAQMQKKGYKIRKSSSMLWEDISALYSSSDFVDHEGKAVTRELTAPRKAKAAAVSDEIIWPFDDEAPP